MIRFAFLMLLMCHLAQAQLEVSTDFTGGSGEVVSLDSESQHVVLNPTHHPDRGWRCWWYVGLSGIQSGKPVTLDVGDAPWAAPDRATFSVDGGQTWQHTAVGVRKNKRIVYSLDVKTDTALVAWGPPFVPSDATGLVEKLDKSSDDASAFVLCHTRENRETPAIRIGSQTRDKPLIWIQARQHAWESGSSWVARGFGEWMISNDPGAVWLRENCEVVLVPIMDIDNVFRGAGGKSQKPQDHNRDWSDEPHWNAVAAAQKEIRAAAESGRLGVFVDLHNPGANDLFSYFYLPEPELQTEEAKQRQSRFLELMLEEMKGPLRYGGKTIVSGSKYDKNWQKISKNWVALLGTPSLAVTLETSWNTPNSNAENYQLVGQQLGQAIFRLLSETAN